MFFVADEEKYQQYDYHEAIISMSELRNFPFFIIFMPRWRT